MDAERVRETYNKTVKEKFEGDYEHHRWFLNPIARAGYEMTLRSIQYHLLNNVLSFKNYLEFGPGPGTWTKFFLEKNPKASFDVVDISREMLALAREKLRQYSQVNYFESDFLEFAPSKQYDFFFSSRAIEYVPNKDAAIAKIANALESEASGFIITKAPKYLRNALLKREISSLHQGQISPANMKELLMRHNCTNIVFYPVTMYAPLLHSVAMNTFIHRVFFKMKLGIVSGLFTESYCVIFKKA